METLVIFLASFLFCFFLMIFIIKALIQEPYYFKFKSLKIDSWQPGDELELETSRKLFNFIHQPSITYVMGVTPKTIIIQNRKGIRKKVPVSLIKNNLTDEQRRINKEINNK